jgi:hypothetical protein
MQWRVASIVGFCGRALIERVLKVGKLDWGLPGDIARQHWYQRVVRWHSKELSRVQCRMDLGEGAPQICIEARTVRCKGGSGHIV